MTDPNILSRRPAKLPTQERGERRVADLLRAAEQLFASEGYDATTMSGIASLAGASIGSLYQFFPNKESVGGALLLAYTDELNDQLDQWKADMPPTPGAFGRKLITVVFDYVSHRPAYTMLAQTPALVSGYRGVEKFSEHIQSLLATYAASMPRKELASAAFAATLMVRATIQGSRMIDARKGAALRKEMQEALAAYLDARFSNGKAKPL